MIASLVKQKVGSCKIVQNQGPDNADLEGRKILPASQKPSDFRCHSCHALPWYLQVFLSVGYRRKRSQQQQQMCLYKRCVQRTRAPTAVQGSREYKGFPELSHELLILPGSDELPFLTAPKHKEVLYSNFQIFTCLHRYTHRNCRGTSLAF